MRTVFLTLALGHAASAFSPLATGRAPSALQVATDPTKEAPAPLFVDATKTRESVQNYYGTELQTSEDLQTNACCTAGAPPKYIQDAINKLHPTTVSKYYGCGLCMPAYDMEGTSVLDLGCGAGRDVYIAAQLVGKEGRVVGVDMTDEQLGAAKEFQDFHAEAFGYKNTEFHKGYLESLDDIQELEPNSFDIIISNCVINLVTDKEAVLKSCYDLLKPGGEMYFSDVYSNRRVPMALQENPLLWGECLSGALYWNDFENMARKTGFADPRLVEDAPITIQSAEVDQMIATEGHAAIEFYSATYRLFKMDNLEPHCEDYGQAVIYKGTMPRGDSGWRLDKHHIFETGKIHPVCGNTWNMIKQNPKIAPHFTFVGNFDKHYGIFEGCGSTMPYDHPFEAAGESGGKGGGCC